jgi:hypothetical protein
MVCYSMSMSEDIKWRKVQAGIYSAEGTTVRVEKRTDTEECWEVTFLKPGSDLRWHTASSSTMREAKDCAFGHIQRERAAS